MLNGQEQRKEIETIKERTIKIKLSDADCERLALKAGNSGLSVSELLENFIGDLVDGTYSNGSDERMYAEQWFERCWFGSFPGETLLRFMLEEGFGVDDVADLLSVYDTMMDFKEHPEKYAEDIAEAKDCGEDWTWFESDYHDYVDEFVEKVKGKADMENEIAICRKWLADYKLLQGR